MDIRVTKLNNGRTQYKAIFRPPLKHYQERLREFANALKFQYGEEIRISEKRIKIIRDSRFEVESFIFVV